MGLIFYTVGDVLFRVASEANPLWRVFTGPNLKDTFLEHFPDDTTSGAEAKIYLRAVIGGGVMFAVLSAVGLTVLLT